jgi:AraC-like DNA-binding protein
MPPRVPRPAAEREVFEVREAKLTGVDLGFPQLAYVTATTDFLSSRVAWHSHDFWEVLMFFRGAARYELEDGIQVEVPGNHFLLVPPGFRHRGDNDVRLPCDFFALGFFGKPPLAECGHSPLSEWESCWVVEQFGLGEKRVFSMSRSLMEQTEQLRRLVLASRAQPLSNSERAMLRHAVAWALVQIAENLGSCSQNTGSARISAAMTFLETHMGRPVGMDAVASAVGIPRKQFYSQFRQETGMTPNDWLQRLRLRRAEELLLSTNLTVESIALELGYPGAAYFCRVFRKYLGSTPGQFRRDAGR